MRFYLSQGINTGEYLYKTERSWKDKIFNNLVLGSLKFKKVTRSFFLLTWNEYIIQEIEFVVFSISLVADLEKNRVNFFTISLF